MDTWDEELDKLDWDAILKESELTDEEKKRVDMEAFLEQDALDYKRSYIRKVMLTHPEILDGELVSLVAEQMLESHEGGVEIDVDDALRFVKDEKPISTEEIVKILTGLGANDENFIEMVSGDFEDGKFGTVKNAEAKKKAKWLTRYADMLAKDKDIVLLGVPTFDPESDYTMAKIAVFCERLDKRKQSVFVQMKNFADTVDVSVDHGVVVVVFMIYNIWADFG